MTDNSDTSAAKASTLSVLVTLKGGTLKSVEDDAAFYGIPVPQAVVLRLEQAYRYVDVMDKLEAIERRVTEIAAALEQQPAEGR